MGNVLNFPVSYFLDEDGNGNISLSSLNQRVDDVSKMLVNGTVIKLDNGAVCSTKGELIEALLRAKDNVSFQTSSTLPNENDASKLKPKKITKKNAFLIGGLIIAAIVVVAIALGVSRRSSNDVYYPSGYTVLKMALDNGDVRLGMTYQEISNIIGEADKVSKSNGVVKYAYYYQSSDEVGGGYTSKQIQLCFDSYGELYKYNE